MEPLTFERSVHQHMRLHVLPTDRFKTFAISVYAGIPLDEQTVTSTALMSFIMRRGTASMPETIQIHEKLDHLYGAGFGLNVYKRGEQQIINISLDTIHDRYVSTDGEKQHLLEESFQFLGELLTKPLVEDGGFRAQYVAAEKITLKQQIEAIINNKTKYAAERCIQEMCKNERYRLHALGKIDEIDAFTAQTLYDHYQRWLQQAVIDVYVVGHTTLDEVEPLITKYFQTDRSADTRYVHPEIISDVRQVNYVTEKMDVSQGKLNLGLRLPITMADDQYSAALMYNGILGTFAHSKLFMNVREKASLAYYASSIYDAIKGIMTIQSGIEIDQYDKALAIINEQLDSMRQGDISELEMEQTKAMLINHLTETQDAAFSIISFDFNRILTGHERQVVDLIDQIANIGIADVQQVAEQVQLDTVYFLRDQKGE